MSRLVTLPTQPCCLAATCWCGPACASEHVCCFCLILLPLPMVRVLPMRCDFCRCSLPPEAAAVLLNRQCGSCQFRLSVLFMELVAYLYCRCGELPARLPAAVCTYVSTLPAHDKLREGALASRGCSAATKCVVVVVVPTICSGATGVWGPGQPFNLNGNQSSGASGPQRPWVVPAAGNPPAVSVSVWLKGLPSQPHGRRSLCTSAAQRGNKKQPGRQETRQHVLC